MTTYINKEDSKLIVEAWASQLNTLVRALNDYKVSAHNFYKESGTYPYDGSIYKGFKELVNNKPERYYGQLEKLNDLFNELYNSITTMEGITESDETLDYRTVATGNTGNTPIYSSNTANRTSGDGNTSVYSSNAATGDANRENSSKYGINGSTPGNTKTEEKKEEKVNIYNPEEVIGRISSTRDGAANEDFIQKDRIYSPAFKDTENLKFEYDEASDTTLISRTLDGNTYIPIGFTKGKYNENSIKVEQGVPANYGSSDPITNPHVKGGQEAKYTDPFVADDAAGKSGEGWVKPTIATTEGTEKAVPANYGSSDPITNPHVKGGYGQVGEYTPAPKYADQFVADDAAGKSGEGWVKPTIATTEGTEKAVPANYGSSDPITNPHVTGGQEVKATITYDNLNKIVEWANERDAYEKQVAKEVSAAYPLENIFSQTYQNEYNRKMAAWDANHPKPM